ncbi:MAG: hypothetical protein WC781_03895 [Candidatus Pacearchaeota archaeon]|jgi:hypothetical protein
METQTKNKFEIEGPKRNKFEIGGPKVVVYTLSKNYSNEGIYGGYQLK